jgi:hypothetical protein
MLYYTVVPALKTEVVDIDRERSTMTRKRIVGHNDRGSLFINHLTKRKKISVVSTMAPIIAGTLQTDARSGGIKKSSGVIVLPIVGESEYILFWLSRNLA